MFTKNIIKIMPDLTNWKPPDPIFVYTNNQEWFSCQIEKGKNKIDK